MTGRERNGRPRDERLQRLARLVVISSLGLAAVWLLVATSNDWAGRDRELQVERETERSSERERRELNDAIQRWMVQADGKQQEEDRAERRRRWEEEEREEREERERDRQRQRAEMEQIREEVLEQYTALMGTKTHTKSPADVFVTDTEAETLFRFRREMQRNEGEEGAWRAPCVASGDVMSAHHTCEREFAFSDAWHFGMPNAVVRPSRKRGPHGQEELRVTDNTRDTPLHQVWQMAVPGTVSELLEYAIRAGVQSSRGERRRCEGEGAEIGLSRSCPLAEWRRISGTRHSVLSGTYRDFTGMNGLVQEVRFGGYATMLLHDPIEYARLTYFSGERTQPELDERFAEEFGVAGKGEVGLAAYSEMAYYHWNVFSRVLAGDYLPHHTSLPQKRREGERWTDEIDRRYAEAMRQQGVESDLHKKAMNRLEELQFIGLSHRLQDSLELLNYTFCWAAPTGDLPVTPRGFASDWPELSREERSLLESVHVSDVALFSRAEDIFEERFAKMRAEKADGLQCNMLLGGCALLC